jgi:hypothetical protein
MRGFGGTENQRKGDCLTRKKKDRYAPFLKGDVNRVESFCVKNKMGENEM